MALAALFHHSCSTLPSLLHHAHITLASVLQHSYGTPMALLQHSDTTPAPLWHHSYITPAALFFHHPDITLTFRASLEHCDVSCCGTMYHVAAWCKMLLHDVLSLHDVSCRCMMYHIAAFTLLYSTLLIHSDPLPSTLLNSTQLYSTPLWLNFSALLYSTCTPFHSHHPVAVDMPGSMMHMMPVVELWLLWLRHNMQGVITSAAPHC